MTIEETFRNKNQIQDVLAYLRYDLPKLESSEQLEFLNNMLSTISDLKAIEIIIQTIKNQILSRSMQLDNPLVQISERAQDKLLSIPEVAQLLKCTRQTIYNKHIPNGLKFITPTGTKGNRKVKKSDLEEYIIGL